MVDRINRRQIVQSLGTAALVGLAGCGEQGGGDETPTEGMAGATEESPDGGDGGEVTASTQVRTYLSETSNFDGTVADMTDQDRPTVRVGAPGNGGNLAFEPAAIGVTQGTTVVWEWTGEGGQHNVVHENGEFESKLTDEAGFTFEHTFDSTGDYLYFCDPHKAVGMKGAVVVEA